MSFTGAMIAALCTDVRRSRGYKARNGGEVRESTRLEARKYCQARRPHRDPPSAPQSTSPHRELVPSEPFDGSPLVGSKGSAARCPRADCARHLAWLVLVQYHGCVAAHPTQD